MKLRRFGSSCLVLLAAPVLSQVAASPPPGPGLATIQERCSSCHSTTSVFSQHRSADDWAETVQLMVDRGADLSADDQNVVVGYLTANFGLKPETPAH